MNEETLVLDVAYVQAAGSATGSRAEPHRMQSIFCQMPSPRHSRISRKKRCKSVWCTYIIVELLRSVHFDWLTVVVSIDSQWRPR